MNAQIALGNDWPELRDAVGRICLRFPLSYWRALEDDHAYPTQFVEDLTRAGFLAALIPDTYGGGGLPLRAAAVILETINRNGCTASQCHAQMYVMGALVRHGSERQKREYLPHIAAGKLRLQAFAVTEPSAGSDTTRLRTRADRDGDSYVVTGQKIWTSRALHSDLMLLLARTTPLAECPKPSQGLSMFLVDIRESCGRGLEIRPIDAMINHNTTELFFDGLRVPAKNLVGEEGNGFAQILDGMNAERILIASEAIGDGRYLLDTAVRYAKERVVFGRSIGGNQGIQFPLARSYAELEAADLMARRAAALFDGAQPCGADANLAKLLAADACWNTADAALQTHGGFGFSREYGIERKWRESRLYRIAPISTNLILAHLSHHVLGLERSY